MNGNDITRAPAVTINWGKLQRGCQNRHLLHLQGVREERGASALVGAASGGGRAYHGHVGLDAHFAL